MPYPNQSNCPFSRWDSGSSKSWLTMTMGEHFVTILCWMKIQWMMQNLIIFEQTFLSIWKLVMCIYLYLMYGLPRWCWEFPGGSEGKASACMQETQIWSLGWEAPLEKEMATHSSILAWRIPGTEEPGRLQSMGSQRVGHDWVTSLHFFSWH